MIVRIDVGHIWSVIEESRPQKTTMNCAGEYPVHREEVY